jgi:hypothetical protein
MKVAVRKCLANDGFDSLLAKSAHKRVRNTDLAESVYCRRFVDDALPRKQSKPPALPAIFSQLGVCYCAPSLT